jgi:hypothetical protein
MASLGHKVCPKILLVEGISDYELLTLAATLFEHEGKGQLLHPNLCIIPAGIGDLGGTKGVVRELICLRGLSRACLTPEGRPRYRIAALFDNDTAGRQGIQAARGFDLSLIECKDLFLLRPVMPTTNNLDPVALQRFVAEANLSYKGLDWEIEDYLPSSLIDVFLEEQPNAVSRFSSASDKTHRDFTRDGKARLLRFVKQHAIYEDMNAIIELLSAVRCYLGVK